MPTTIAADVPWCPGGGRGKLKAMDKTTYPPNRFPPTTPDVDASVEASLWQPPSATNGATSTAAQQWEAQSTGKRILPGVVIGVAVVALIVGMNYQFKHNDHDTTLAQGQANESIINEAPPVTPAPETSTSPATAPAVEAAPAVVPPPEPAPAPVVKPRAETPPPAPAPRHAPAAVTPRAPAVPPADTGMRAPLPEPTPTPTPTPAPTPSPLPSGQVPQPLPDTSPQPPLPVPTPTPAPQPAPEPINSN